MFFLTVADYLRENGFKQTIVHIGRKLISIIIPEKTILLYLDLNKYADKQYTLPDNWQIEKIVNIDDISENDKKILFDYRGEKKVKKQLRKWFKIDGIRLYLYKVDEKFVGFVWAAKGRYVAPYYIPFSSQDGSLLDTEVFPEFRGKGFSPIFTNYVTTELWKEGVTRIYISVSEWNTPSLKSLKKTPFIRYGTARKIPIFGYNFVMWY